MITKLSETAPKSSARDTAWICVFLVLIVVVVFGQTAGFPFVNYDDTVYVTDNPMVKAGLTIRGFLWALHFGEIGHWHPLTWLSHMLDCQMFGLWAGGHHITNVALHAAATVLLFFALREITGRLWRSAFVSALFAIHPLRVESVVWIAERKDVLSGFFFMLTLLAYARYAARPSRAAHAWVTAVFALGLLCKNTLVTLPFVLILLDWWPLRRNVPLGRRLLEKIPLFLLTAGSCVMTFLAPEKLPESDRLHLYARLGNAIVSCAIYLRQMFCPTSLAVPYPNPVGGWPTIDVLLAFLVLATITVLAVSCRMTRPYLLTGWLWYLGMLVPTSGIVQISYYSHADRYTYLPGIGIAIAVTWLVADWTANWKHRKVFLGATMASVLGALIICASIQTQYWESSENLWTRSLACTRDNYIAEYNMGVTIYAEGREDEAIGHLRNALKIHPDYPEACNNLGIALKRRGDLDEAIILYEKAVKLDPGYGLAFYNLGIALQQKGKIDDAIGAYEKALQILPGVASIHNNLGDALLKKGDLDEAIVQFQKAVEIDPGLAIASHNLDHALAQKQLRQTK